jgi:hypothetical protein
LVNDVDITNEGWTRGAAEVHQAPAGEHGEALAVGEDELIHLGLDVLFLDLGVLLEPGDLDLESKWPMLQRIASSFMPSCARRVTTSAQPVAVTKMSACGRRLSIVT